MRASARLTRPVAPARAAAPASPIPPSLPVRRTSEIEDPTNLYVVHVAAHWLTLRLARLGVHPNAVSITGMLAGLGAALAYRHPDSTGWACAGFALMLAWHVLDGTDGQLARMTRTQSELGRILDGVCDYATFAAVYVALALQLAHRHGPMVWPLVAVAGLCHAVQSAAYEQQRQDYEIWGWGRAPAAPPAPTSFLARSYGRLQSVLAGPAGDRERLARRLRTDEQRARYRRHFAPPIRRWSILSANTRTMALFACVLARRPMLYFELEIAALTPILAVLTIRQRFRLSHFLTAEPS